MRRTPGYMPAAAGTSRHSSGGHLCPWHGVLRDQHKGVIRLFSRTFDQPIDTSEADFIRLNPIILKLQPDCAQR